MQVNEKKLEYTSICSYLAKIVITDENLYSKTKKYKSFWTPKRKQDDAGCWVKSRPPPSVNLGIGTGWRGAASQWGELPEVMWLEEAEFRGSLCDLPAWTTL